MALLGAKLISLGTQMVPLISVDDGGSEALASAVDKHQRLENRLSE